MSAGANGVGPYANTTTPRGYQQISLAAGTVQSLTAPVGIPGPFLVVIQADGGAARYRDDGTNPTNAIGFLIADGGTIVLQPEAISTIKLIRDGADTGNVNILYYTAATSTEA